MFGMTVIKIFVNDNFQIDCISSGLLILLPVFFLKIYVRVLKGVELDIKRELELTLDEAFSGKEILVPLKRMVRFI